jgi:hypothetical protein
MNRSARGRDLYERRHCADELPERRAGAVAQRGARAGEEQRGDEAAAQGQRVVADGVDAAVDGAQPARCRSVFDLVAAEPEGEELPAGDNPALTSGEPGDLGVSCAFGGHSPP